eukprot:562088-Pelagomonas_calceolata.AAC.1
MRIRWVVGHAPWLQWKSNPMKKRKRKEKLRKQTKPSLHHIRTMRNIVEKSRKSLHPMILLGNFVCLLFVLSQGGLFFSRRPRFSCHAAFFLSTKLKIPHYIVYKGWAAHQRRPAAAAATTTCTRSVKGKSYCSTTR